MAVAVWLAIPAGGALASDQVVFYPPKGNISVKLDILFELFRSLENDLGVHFRMTEMPWKRAIQMAESGAGGIMPFSRNAERLERFDFSDEVFRDEIVLVVLRGREFSFHGIDDLKGKTVGYLGGASVGEEFERGRRDVFRSDMDFAGPETRLKKLLAGRIDVAVVSTGAAGLRSIIALDEQLQRAQDRFVILPTPLVSDANYLAFAKGMNMAGFLADFNRALDAARKDGRYQRIIDAYRPATEGSR